MPGNMTRIWLVLEFVILFFGIPLLIYLDKDFIHPSIIILPVLVFIFILLRRTSDFSWRELIRWKISRRALAVNSLVVLVCAMLVLGYVFFFDRENLFNLPRSHPWIYLAICLFYPVFSAYGQEIIYRTALARAPSSDPTKVQFLRPTASLRNCLSETLFVSGKRPSWRKRHRASRWLSA